MLCLHCQRDVKVNQIVRSAHHDLGCVFCYGKPEAETPVMVAERIASRGEAVFSKSRIMELFGE